MSLTHSVDRSRMVNRAVVAATLYTSVAVVLLLAGIALLNAPGDIIIASVVYGFSLLACSLCSYMYTMRTNIDDRRLWRHLDHAAIFLLIAGTYTPFAAAIDGPFGLGLMYWVWGLAFLGIAMRLLIRRGFERVFVFLYILIGWLFVTALPEIVRETNHLSLWLLAAGAGSYTIGALLFARDIGRWTDPVWHGCVLGGCFLHFMAVLALLSSQGYLSFA